MEIKFKTREDWLVAACDKIKTHFKWFEFPEKIKVSCGLCNNKAIGLCMGRGNAKENDQHIFIDPCIENSSRVLDILIHELCHAHLHMVSQHHKGHGKDFSLVAERFGLMKPWKATTAGKDLQAILDSFVSDLGPYPHKAIDTKTKIRFGKSEEEKSRQYVCPGGDYAASIKNKYAQEKLPKCPLCLRELELKRTKKQLEMGF